MSTTDALIDAVTREVMAALADKGACDCSDPACHGACAAHCADKVRSVVSTGAERVSYSGNGPTCHATSPGSSTTRCSGPTRQRTTSTRCATRHAPSGSRRSA